MAYFQMLKTGSITDAGITQLMRDRDLDSNILLTPDLLLPLPKGALTQTPLHASEPLPVRSEGGRGGGA